MMLPRLFAAFLLSALALVLAAPTRAEEPNPDEEQEVPYEKLSATGKNVVKMTMARQLKDMGWGVDKKGPRYEEYSLPSLLRFTRSGVTHLPRSGSCGSTGWRASGGAWSVDRPSNRR